jgi:hypothetical protein
MEVNIKADKLHNEAFRNYISSPDIIRKIKSRMMRWAGHTAHMGDGRGVDITF